MVEKYLLSIIEDSDKASFEWKSDDFVYVKGLTDEEMEKMLKKMWQDERKYRWPIYYKGSPFVSNVEYW